MSESKHTPGPWTVGRGGPNGCPTIHASGVSVCMVARSVNLPDQRETAIADANLLSAGPDMLASLKDTLELTELYAGYIRNWVKAEDLETHPYLPSIEDGIDRAKAAIAKAEGRP